METSALWNAGKIYLKLPKDNLNCFVKICAQSIDGKVDEIAVSNLIEMPSEKEFKASYGNYKFMVKL